MAGNFCYLIWADIRGQSCKRIRRSQLKIYWALNSYKWTVPKPIWFQILSAQFWENVIWKWLKIGESAKVTRDGNLPARQRHKNPESFITWEQLDRISNDLNKSKMHGKLARGRGNNLHKLPQIDSVIVRKLAKNKGGWSKSHEKRANRIWKGIFFNHIRKVICGRNLKDLEPWPLPGFLWQWHLNALYFT